jgi:hypothetical protein
MRILAIALLATLLTTAAFAQGMLGKRTAPGTPPKDTTPKIKVDEKDYRAAVKSIPDQKGESDPWRGIRGGDGAKGQKAAK